MRISDWSSDVCSSDLADTLTAGVVMEPAFIPGFRASVDYYNINIKGAIANLGRQETMDECYLRNNQTACDNITIVAGTNYRIDLPNLNLDALKMSGIDFERSEEHTSELQSLMRISYAVFCLKTIHIKSY